MQVERFRINVEDHVLEDLQLRLDRTNLGNNAEFDTQRTDYGQDFAFQASLLEHWRTAYDWKKYEQELNSFAHFRAVVPGSSQKLHFIHERSRVPGAVPLLLLHGWPGSVWEFHNVIRPLVSPEPGRALRLKQAFHVVAPSLPGFAWSDATTQPGMGARQTAALVHQLMLQLGYKQYGVQGGDWGSQVAKFLALDFPEHCVAMHVNLVMVAPPMTPAAVAKNPLVAARLWTGFALAKFAPDWLADQVFSPRDKQGLERAKQFLSAGNQAYFNMQSHKPHTPGFALSDSPSGLLAWISEKLQLCVDGKGNVLNALSKDEIITNVMIYWVTNSITSSMRFYRESERFGGGLAMDEYVAVPTAWASFPEEIMGFPKHWVEQRYNLVQHTEFSEGGHFAAWEQPALYVQDLRQFFHRTMPFDKACALAEERAQLAFKAQQPATQLDLATNLLFFAPALPIPAVAGLASYLLLSKL